MYVAYCNGVSGMHSLMIDGYLLMIKNFLFLISFILVFYKLAEDEFSLNKVYNYVKFVQ